MQTTPISQSTGSYPSTATTTSYARLTTYERQDLSVSYTDGNSSVVLNLSQEVLTDTVIYSETGAAVRQPLSAPAADTAATEAVETGSALIEDAFARYAELIRDRVDYLLRKISDAQQQINGNNADETGTVLYTESTSVVNSSLSIEATGVDLSFFTPEQTAGRIVDFALSFYDGGDRTAYAAKIKAAVMEGFEQALGAMGGLLPQESYDTISLATDAIDQWAMAGVDMTA